MPRTSKPTNGADGPATPKRPATKKANGNGNGALSSDEIARRAYEIYQQRGGSHGADFDDWLEAERQLMPPAKAKAKGRSAQG